MIPISEEDGELAANRGVVVDTTRAIVPRCCPSFSRAPIVSRSIKIQSANLKLLYGHAVKLASVPIRCLTHRTAKSATCAD
jgi:hypothetical protein